MPTGKSSYLFLDDPFYWLICGSVIVAVLYLELIVHEFGHWFAARLVGHRVLGFTIGEGKRLTLKQKSGCFYDFRLLPSEGWVLHVREKGDTQWWQDFFISAAGPLGTAFCLVVAVVLDRGVSYTILPEPWPLLVHQTLTVVIALTVISLFYNAFPWGLLGGGIGNDGNHMLRTLLHRRDYPAPPFYQKSLQLYGLEIDEQTPHSDFSRQAYSRRIALLTQQDFSAAHQVSEEVLELPELAASERAFFLSHAAVLAVDLRQRAFARQALDHMEEALEIVPANLHFQFYHSALMVDLQQYDDGIHELEKLIGHESIPAQIEAAALSWLAIADHRQGRRESSIERMKQAAKLDPLNPAVLRAIDEIKGTPPGYSDHVKRP